MNDTLTDAPNVMPYDPSAPAKMTLSPFVKGTSPTPLFQTALPGTRFQVPLAGSIIPPLVAFPLSQTSPLTPTICNSMLAVLLVRVQTPLGIVPGTNVPEPLSDEYCVRTYVPLASPLPQTVTCTVPFKTRG